MKPQSPSTKMAALEPPLAALGVRTATWIAPAEPEPPVGSFDGLIVLGGIVNPDGTGGDAPLDRERVPGGGRQAEGFARRRHGSSATDGAVPLGRV